LWKVSSVKEEEIECHNGKKINVNRILAKDAYKFSLWLLDVLFTKEELHDHLLLPSKKSEKPPLDKCRVNLMFDLIDKRFGKKWDLSEVTKCCNQKCRDAVNYLSEIDIFCCVDLYFIGIALYVTGFGKIDRYVTFYKIDFITQNG